MIEKDMSETSLMQQQMVFIAYIHHSHKWSSHLQAEA